MSIDDANKALTGTGGRTVKWDAVGNAVKGVVVDADLMQQRDYKTGEPATWPDGNPKMQVVITLQTDSHEDEDDDGIRKVYAKGQMQSELRRAVGRVGLEIGGKLAVKYIGDGDPPARGMNAPKLFKVWYEAPARAAVDIGGGDLVTPF